MWRRKNCSLKYSSTLKRLLSDEDAFRKRMHVNRLSPKVTNFTCDY